MSNSCDETGRESLAGGGLDVTARPGDRRAVTSNRALFASPERTDRSAGQGLAEGTPTTRPALWIDTGTQPVLAVRFASGRVIEATANHRWAVRSREGSRRPTWKSTASLEPGCAAPASLTADFFGTLGDEWEGWFVGSMLGDGNMTGRTPTWVGHDDGTLQQIRQYVSKHGCQVNVEDNGTWPRARLVDPQWRRNALRDATC